MTPSLSTQIHRSRYALPLLAVGLSVALGAGALPSGASTGAALAAPAPRVVVVEVAHPAGAASTLPGAVLSDAATLPYDTLPGGSCDTPRPPGARGLARMPGDITALAGRLRCAR